MCPREPGDLPVLVSRLKAIRHYFSEDALAFFEPNDASDLAKQMVRLYRDQPLRARLVTNARAEYAPIRWELMKQRYLELMDHMRVGVPSMEGRRHEIALATVAPRKRTLL